jgi:hypothetical protein
MRLFSVLILVFLLFIQPLGKTWIYVSFKINQAYIAKNLCVQKEIEGNSCKGCCQLKKEIKKAEDQEQKSLPKGVNLKTETIFYSRAASLGCLNHIPQTKNVNYYLMDQHFIQSTNIDDIFHPPKKIS